ncbi:gamma-aminobutyric acid type B receptor subunit 2 isoform X2 [Lutzomyia longipalpis]|uniref:gamma-aminobutyric acid type B receptor subunit 2 isoform X2 n=1 Tax=Lutzomyia longipalpis TaxID=7200 RepID=UPI002483AAE9|nr:gamma-aminobutyric acid type B receptor subunit 2 isoform X2 [Lutzomyia longipalpis]
MKNVHICLGFVVLLTAAVARVAGGQSQRPSSSHRLDVYIAGFFPYGDGVENAHTGRGVMPSVKLALDHVNEHSTILRNYRLHMWWNDTECNAAVGVKSFFDMMHSGPHKLMLFGAACTHVTDPIAKASKHWHLTQLSYADTHPMFTKDAFPNFFRVVPSENAFNAPRLALLRRFNWTRVGTIYQNEPRYSLPHNHMVADLDAMGMEVVETQSFVQDVSESLRKLKEKDVRIILGNFNETWARRVFCEAYRLEMYGRSYQWLIMGTYNAEWWNTSADCNQEELQTALESTIMTDLLPLSTSGDITISGITPDEYLTEYDKRRGGEYSRFHGYTYDGIWAVALAIQYVSQRKDQLINKFQYRIKEWENIFIEALKNTSFEGVTGPVRFYNNERKASILLKQFQTGVEVKIGEYNSMHGHLDLSLGEQMRWVGRSPPKDRTVLLIEHSQVNLTIYAVLASCSVAGIIMAVSFLIVNIMYRNQRYIKMSSPHLNNLIIIGCMLTYLSVIFLGLDSGLSSIAAFPYICTARAWLLMAGFSLAFGAMFSKTWRVHSIFTDLKLNKKVIKDYQLFMVVGVLLAIDLAIMTTWQIADPFYRDTKQMEPYPHPSLEDVLIARENEYCQSEKITVFIGVIYAYKGLLLIFGAFLAWETRHVSIPALNDSKHIGLSVYNVVIMCIMGAAIAIVLSDRKDAAFILISVFIIFCTTATLCLVFVPKIVELKRNPSGVVDKRIRATLRPMSKNRRDSSVCELEQRLRDVKTTNCKFRKALMEREAELQSLIRKLGPEARSWLDGSLGDLEPLKDTASRLSVPPIRREMPSTTETTDLTSIGSLTSTHADLDNSLTPNQRKRVTTISSGSDIPITQPLRIEERSVHYAKQCNDVQQTQMPNMERRGTMHESNRSLNEMQPTIKYSPSSRKMEFAEQNRPKMNSHMNSSTHSVTHSNTELNNICPHAKDLSAEQQRRVSLQVGSAAIKGGFVVSQSDLWDTHTLSHAKQHQRQAARTCQNAVRCQEHGYQPPAVQQQQTQTPEHHPPTMSPQAPIQRSVSEKNRTKHRHKSKASACQSETDSERERESTPTHTCSQPAAGGRKLAKTMQHHAHHRSSPNVAPGHKHRHRTDSSIYGASSESELLEDGGDILPIFRKLLTEREPRYRGRSNMVGASCPNISIKCDIVEYL